MAALDQTGYLQTPPSPTKEDNVLFDNLQIDVDDYRRDIYTVSAILGSRWNDLHGNSSIDIGELNQVHNPEENQDEHCLRGLAQDGEVGNQEAVDACKDFIRDMFENILATANADGSLNPDVRADFPIYILYRGTMDVSLSSLYFHAGRALHTIQDSFSHVYRTFPDLKAIETVLNWPDYVRGQIDESRDGPAHSFTLDECECDRDHNDATTQAAISASTDFLALLDDDDPASPSSVADRRARLEAFLDEWFTVTPGCNSSNNFCNNPNHAEADWECDNSSDLINADSILGCAAFPQKERTESSLLVGIFLWIFVAVLLFLSRGFILERYKHGRS